MIEIYRKNSIFFIFPRNQRKHSPVAHYPKMGRALASAYESSGPLNLISLMESSFVHVLTGCFRLTSMATFLTTP